MGLFTCWGWYVREIDGEGGNFCEDTSRFEMNEMKEIYWGLVFLSSWSAEVVYEQSERIGHPKLC